MDFLEKLNKQQYNAVTAGNGPVLVVAGPGSGKTRVLTQRIAYLIAVEGVRPWQILAVTFTNKAAKEMEARVKSLLPDQATEGIMLGTFHSICARILRREAEHLPLGSNFVIFDTDDQERIVKTVIRELNINEKLYRPPSVHAAISRAKNELIGPDDYPTLTYRDEIVKRVYVEYQKRLIASNAVDFDDLLLYSARLLEDNLSVRDKYAQRFRHVLVDEFQVAGVEHESVADWRAARCDLCVDDGGHDQTADAREGHRDRGHVRPGLLGADAPKRVWSDAFHDSLPAFPRGAAPFLQLRIADLLQLKSHSHCRCQQGTARATVRHSPERPARSVRAATSKDTTTRERRAGRRPSCRFS